MLKFVTKATQHNNDSAASATSNHQQHDNHNQDDDDNYQQQVGGIAKEPENLFIMESSTDTLEPGLKTSFTRIRATPKPMLMDRISPMRKFVVFVLSTLLMVACVFGLVLAAAYISRVSGEPPQQKEEPVDPNQPHVHSSWTSHESERSSASSEIRATHMSAPPTDLTSRTSYCTNIRAHPYNHQYKQDEFFYEYNDDENAVKYGGAHPVGTEASIRCTVSSQQQAHVFVFTRRRRFVAYDALIQAKCVVVQNPAGDEDMRPKAVWTVRGYELRYIDCRFVQKQVVA